MKVENSARKLKYNIDTNDCALYRLLETLWPQTKKQLLTEFNPKSAKSDWVEMRTCILNDKQN